MSTQLSTLFDSEPGKGQELLRLAVPDSIPVSGTRSCWHEAGFPGFGPSKNARLVRAFLFLPHSAFSRSGRFQPSISAEWMVSCFSLPVARVSRKWVTGILLSPRVFGVFGETL